MCAFLLSQDWRRRVVCLCVCLCFYTRSAFLFSPFQLQSRNGTGETDVDAVHQTAVSAVRRIGGGVATIHASRSIGKGRHHAHGKFEIFEIVSIRHSRVAF